jgi:DNA-binding transcriptional LysR family regulator
MFNRPADEEKLAGKTLVSVGFLLAAPANSPIARTQTRRLADMAKEPFVWIPRETAPVHYDRMLMMCNQAGFSPQIAQYATTETGRLSMVAAGVGCAIVTSAAELGKPEQVKLVGLSDVKLKIDLELVWRTDNDSPTLKNFLRAVETGRPAAKGTRKKQDVKF